MSAQLQAAALLPRGEFQPLRQPAGFPPRVSLAARLLLPSLGAAVFAVTLLHVLFLSGGSRSLFRDSDAGWHVVSGEIMLARHSIPRVDAFSYTRAGHEWFAWEWLTDLTLGVVHTFAGLPGIALLAAFVIAASIWLSSRLALALGANFFFTAAAAMLALASTSIHWLARPHLVSWLLALAFLALAETARHSRLLFLLPALACLWANVHGSFLLGPAILACYVAGECLARRPVRRLALVMLLSLLATFINPYGWKLHAHVSDYLGNGYLMDHIAEFRSVDFHAPGAVFLELFLLAAVAGLLAMIRQRSYGGALLAMMLLHLSLYSARHVPIAALLLLPLAAAALTREASGSARLAAFLEYSNRLRQIDRAMIGAVPVAIVAAASVVALAGLQHMQRVGFDPARFPVNASHFLERQGLHDRVFATDQWGGYFLYRFAGRMKVFIDGRSDFYGREHLERYARVLELQAGWADVLEQEKVRYVVIPPAHALAFALHTSGNWKRVYGDSVAAIFERII